VAKFETALIDLVLSVEAGSAARRVFSIADHWLVERNLTIWNAAIYCTLVVRDILMVSLR
jgi:hypothetical protein